MWFKLSAVVVEVSRDTGSCAGSYLSRPVSRAGYWPADSMEQQPAGQLSPGTAQLSRCHSSKRNCSRRDSLSKLKAIQLSLSQLKATQLLLYQFKTKQSSLGTAQSNTALLGTAQSNTAIAVTAQSTTAQNNTALTEQSSKQHCSRPALLKATQLSLYHS